MVGRMPGPSLIVTRTVAFLAPLRMYSSTPLARPRMSVEPPRPRQMAQTREDLPVPLGPMMRLRRGPSSQVASRKVWGGRGGGEEGAFGRGERAGAQAGCQNAAAPCPEEHQGHARDVKGIYGLQGTHHEILDRNSHD